MSNLGTDLNVSHPLTKLAEELRENEEIAMKRRIELNDPEFSLKFTLCILFIIFCCIGYVQNREFKRKEQEKFSTFCNNLEKECNILSEFATEQRHEFDKFIESTMNHNTEITENEVVLFDFKLNSLMKIEKDYNELMQENLKLENEDVYNYINDDNLNATGLHPQTSKMSHISSGSSLNSQQNDLLQHKEWLELNDSHQIKLRLPINEMGEISFMNNKSNNSLDFS